MPRFGADRLSRSFFLSSIFTLSTFLSPACGRGHHSHSTSSTDPQSSPTPGPNETFGTIDAAAPGELDLTLYLEETAGVARDGEPVRSGVPVPRTVDLRTTDRLVVMSEHGVVPCQFRVTSRWEGAPDDASKPIKWLLVDFPADVAKDGTTIYRLRTRDGAQQSTGSLVSENAADHFTIDTGAAKFVVSKSHFDILSQVTLADGTVVEKSDGTTGAFLTTPDGTRFSASAGTTSVTLEEDGPLHAVIIARGQHASASSKLLDWTIRIHFWKARPDAEIAYTFTERDLADIRKFVTVDEMGIELPIAPGANPRYAIGGETSDATGALSGEASQRATGKLSPTLASNFNPGDASTLSYADAGSASGSGNKAPGWVDVTGDAAGITAAARWFWQLYPKKIAARPDRLVVDLWPKEDVDMRVYSGAQKTHEILYSFHLKSIDGALSGHELVARIDHPLFARCNPAWYAGSEVWNRIGTSTLDSYAPEHQHVADAYFQHLMGRAFPATFVDRAFNGAGTGHSYSMWDFGDGREDYWSNLAYDTPRALLIHFGITGDRAFLDRGVEAAVHLRDVDIEHSPQDTRAGITLSRGVSMPWLGRTRYTPSQGPASHDLGNAGRTGYGFEHSKGQGLADHYFLTGDMESKEILAETYHYFEQWKVDADNGFLRTDGTRVVSHMLLVLLGYADAFGTAEARTRVDFCVNYLNDWQRRHTTKNPNGMMWMSSGDTTSMFMNAVTAESLLLYEVDYPDGIAVKQNILDAAKWTMDPRNGQLVHGSQGDYFNAWTNNNYGASHATVLDAMIGPWLGYATAATGDQTYVEEAKKVLLNSFTQDQSTPFLKAFTQQTRLVPAFLWFLQTDDAKKQPAA